MDVGRPFVTTSTHTDMTLDWLRARGYDSVVALPPSVSREEFVVFEATRIQKFLVVNSDTAALGSRGGDAARTSDAFVEDFMLKKFETCEPIH